jgi:iron complex outermembrane receptor protein
MQRNRLSFFVRCSLVLMAATQGVAAQDATTQQQAPPDAGQTEATTLDQVTVLGSRRVVRSSDTQSPVPVDVIPMAQAAEQGAQFDLAQTLQYTAPSLISTRQTGADGADLIDGAALRGLGSDQTLVLVNGKRRHTVSLVNIYGARDRGNTGTDLNSLPMLAIDRVAYDTRMRGIYA